MEEQELKEKVQKIEKEATEFLQSANLEELIKNNSCEFTIGDVKYRVTRPTFSQKQETLKERNKKFISLLKDSNNLMEKDLIAVYAQRGISIADIDNKYKTLQAQREDYDKKLGSALVENKTVEELEIFKKEIEAILVQQNQLLMEKSILLESTVESQVQVFAYTYLASVITERLVEDKWVRAWSSYEEFTKEHESTVNVCVWYASLVSKNELSGL